MSFKAILILIVVISWVVSAIRKAAEESKRAEEARRRAPPPKQGAPRSGTVVTSEDLETFLGRRRTTQASLGPATPVAPHAPVVRQFGPIIAGTAGAPITAQELEQFLARRGQQGAAGHPQSASAPLRRPSVTALGHPSHTRPPQFLAQQPTAAAPAEQVRQAEGSASAPIEPKKKKKAGARPALPMASSPIPFPARLSPLQQAVLFGEVFGRPGGRYSQF